MLGFLSEVRLMFRIYSEVDSIHPTVEEYLNTFFVRLFLDAIASLDL